MNCKRIEIKNLPENPRPWIVVRLVDGDYWFYGSWDEPERAYEVSADVIGQVFPRELIRRAQ